MLHKSIRWRIELWHGALLACLVTGMMAAFFVYTRDERLREVDEQLNNALTPLMPRFFPVGPDGRLRPHGPGGPPPGRRFDMEGPDDPNRPPPPDDRIDSRIYYAAWSGQGELLGKSTNAPPLERPARADQKDQRHVRSRDWARELVLFDPRGTSIIVGMSTDAVAAEMRSFVWKEAAVGIGLVVFGLVGGWWVAGHVLKPIGVIGSTAGQIAGGDRSRRISVQEADSELGQLAAVLNRTFDRLDEAFAQQVQFTADASHELRTPVAVILTQTQLALSRDRSAEEYRESFGICQRAAERMRTLINALLDLARMDASGFGLTLEDCDLRRVADDALAFVAPLAEQKGAVLRSSVESVHLQADGAKLGQVVVNLLQNALQHCAHGVEVCLSLQPKEGYVLLIVSDNGGGIPDEALPRLFDRFYRVDKSRSRSTGGSGLGLAICKAIVEAHKGSIKVRSELGKGTEFQIILPLVTAQKAAA